MTGFFEALGKFTSQATIWVYLFIFFGKIIEVTFCTLRIVLINRGERVIGSILALIEVTLWLVIAGSVLSDYQSDPLKMLAYAAAYALGTFTGSWLEERLAFGLCSIQTVVMEQEACKAIADKLRSKGFGVTELEVQGRADQNHYMLITTLKRKLADEAISVIQSVTPKAVITVSDVKTQKGGYLRSAASRRKRISK